MSILNYIPQANQTGLNYEGLSTSAQALFEACQKQWNESKNCEASASQLRGLLEGDGAKMARKLVCFALEHLNSKPPGWWRDVKKPEEEWELETNVVEGPMIRHAIALTMAEVIHSFAKLGDERVRLLTQDPAYTSLTKGLLQNIGFEIIGDGGAG
ncbi:hypothetical protein LSUE1_G007867 [Lachnellula suecica]|uniref:SRR1-like domain-containing protein n=1 Tax=Lachnellula suecica TaxID=602035 RepID=A0A8T9BWN6_9HELO|nr:hypothetical protein LSUE1_G007867 [Lachnellula suecica]